MRIGISSGGPVQSMPQLPGSDIKPKMVGPPVATLDEFVTLAQRLEALGLDTLWMGQAPHTFDALATLAVVGRETGRIELGTGVAVTYPRHPMVMAQGALTASAAAGGRFTLGIGVSHRILVEDMLGMSYEPAARHTREYLEVLAPLLRGESVAHTGHYFQVHGELDVAGAGDVSLLVAALGPAMLKVAGELADGTITWMCGPRTLGEHVIPTLQRAAEAAGRNEPRVVAYVPIALTGQPDAARREAAPSLVFYGMLPSYRAMLEREGVDDPVELALLGDEKYLQRELDRYRDLGVSDISASLLPVDDDAVDRTLEFLATLT